MKEHAVGVVLPGSTYQIKISLKEVKPPIWRRLQVPGSISLHKLHKILQVVMGWCDYHLFEFRIGNKAYGIPDDGVTYELEDARRRKLRDVLQEGDKADYAYDFGDGWECRLLIEKVIPVETEPRYAVCLKGARSGPPEDCGGPWGYEDLLGMLKLAPQEVKDEDTKSMRDWIGEDFDPEHIDVQQINAQLRRVR